MIVLFLLFLISLGIYPFTSSSSLDCSNCVGSGQVWCVEQSQCNSSFVSCSTKISLQLNCPTKPKVPYDEHFARTQMLALASASHNANPQLCLDNQIPTMKLYKVRTVNCSTDYPDVACYGYTAYDVTQKAIVISYRGSHGPNQNNQILEGMTRDGLHSYFGKGTGKIFKVIYDSFMLLWNDRINQDLRYLKYKYPDFELWLNGHSLGGALSYTTASYLTTVGLYKPENMKIIVLAPTKIGDYDFAAWYSSTFSYSFHIIHRLDLIPRVPAIDPHTNTTVMFQPRTEIWYNNYMRLNDTYQICEEADGDYCSDAVTEGLNMNDHGFYFDINISNWGKDGCPKNTTGYAQP